MIAHVLYLNGSPCATVCGNSPRETCDAVEAYLQAQGVRFEYAGAGEWETLIHGVLSVYRVDYAHTV